MKIRRKIPRYSVILRTNQFPWSSTKMVKFKKRKWSRIKFSFNFLKKKVKNRNWIMKLKIFNTYKKKTKQLFRRYFAPRLTDRQCKKLFRSNSRYKATFKQVLKSEYRFDTLVFRLYFLPDINIARNLIQQNFFLINGKPFTMPKLIVQTGDIIEPSNKISWLFLYNNMISVIASLKKYLNRILFKFSFPFVIKRRKFRFKEFGRYKEKLLNRIYKKIPKRITKRVYFLRYKKIKSNTISKINPPKKYYFIIPKYDVKVKRNKQYILKKQKLREIYKNQFFKTISLKKKQLNVSKNVNRKVQFLKRLIGPFIGWELNKKRKKNIYVKKNRGIKRKNFLFRSYKQYIKLIRILKRKLKFRKKRVFKKRKTISSRKNIQNLKKNTTKKIKEKKYFFKHFFKFSKNKKNTVLKRSPKVLTFQITKNIHHSKKKIVASYKMNKIMFKKKNQKYNFKLKHFVPPKNVYITKSLFKTYLTIPANKTKNIKKFKTFFVNSSNNNKISASLLYKKLILSSFFYKKKQIKLLIPKNKNFQLFIKEKKTKQPKWRRWIPKLGKNYWQFNRITKKHIFNFRYLKKFNNHYKQYFTYQKLKQILWVSLEKNKTIFQKTNFLYLKKRKKLLSRTKNTSVNYFFSSAIQINNSNLQNLKEFKTTFRRVKRKYLRLKGFYRRYKNLKLEVILAPKNKIYNPIEIKYKKINLLFKHRPIAYYFAESNFKTLEFTIVGDVDFLYFPYRTFFDFKMLSFIYPK